LLEEAWPTIQGSEQESMASWKLGRIEKVGWSDPVLGFVVERHGGTVLGSTRTELQAWTVDLERREASCAVAGYRQRRPMRARFDADTVATEIVESVTAERVMTASES
jgi:hypothetical protein